MRYFNGEVRLEATDISAPGFGIPWGHSRTYSNQQKQDFDRGNGWNWNPVNLPRFGASTLSGSALALYSNLYNIRYFYASGGPAYLSQFGDLGVLVHVDSTNQLRLTEADGSIWTFNDLSVTSRKGGFRSMTAPGGATLAVVQESADLIQEVQRTATAGAIEYQDSFVYGYVTTGELSGHISSVTHRSRIDGGSWTNVSQVEFSYYSGGEDHGSSGDLRTATRRTWDVSVSSWADLGTDYYRYYKPGNAKGSAHDLKFVLGPQSFVRVTEEVGDPFTVSDGTLSMFADFYYEYNGDDRVSLERVYSGSKTMSFSYSRNPRYPASSSSSSSSASAPPGNNVWIYRTVETRPDDSQKINYANFAGQTMLSVLKKSSTSTDQWCTFFRYDDEARQIWVAQPSAVLGYDDQYDDLLNYQTSTGKYAFLRDHDGLIQVTEYFTDSGSSSSSSPTSSLNGYLKANKIKKGQLGSPILLRSLEYTSHTEDETTVHPVSRETTYPDAADPATKIETTYAYTFHTGTNQVAQKTTTLPVVPTSQNGSGSAATRKAYFDLVGNLTWIMNERGFITKLVYDTLTGTLIQRIDDVDTSVVSGAPSGWNTPSGGGLNLVTDYECDPQGRITQQLGPQHTIDVGGVATSVRSAIWTVYDDAHQAVRTATGYATGSAPSYSFTLVNPVEIREFDKSGKPTAVIRAVRASTSGKLQPTDTFAQSSYVRWMTYQYTECCLLASQRVYHTIPASGPGSAGTNYDETSLGYDVMKRRNRTLSPGGTISFSVADVRNLPIGQYVGTDDIGASWTDPTGNGTPGNNMVQVSASEYDNGDPGGDGNLTLATAYVDASTTRVTSQTYDWRNRLLTVTAPESVFTESTYDNFDRVVTQQSRDTNSSGTVLSRVETFFDDRGRVYQTKSYGLNATTALTSKAWFDAAGNTIKSLPAGSNLFTKVTYDSLNRVVTQSLGYDLTESSYAQAGSVSDDVLLEQIILTYNQTSTVIQTASKQRYHDAPDSQKGPLGDPSTTPNARVTWQAVWTDGIGRQVAAASYGTNGGTALTRPATIPSRSDTVLVSTVQYNDAGERELVFDPIDQATRFEYDDAGRTVKLVENYQPSGPVQSDVNRTTETSYNADGNVATLAAWNTSTGNQTTNYTYGTTLSDSDIATSTLLQQVAYPDSVDGSDVVLFAYNRQGQRKAYTDQRGCSHEYLFDGLGRQIHDCVTAVGTGVDAVVRRLSTEYEVRGLVSRMSSFDNATVGTGNVLNQVQNVYNDFAQLTQSYQAHGGEVNTGTTPQVQYSYADGSSNTIRITGMTYPNGRNVVDDYGTTGSMNDAASRIFGMKDSGASSNLVEYSYLGLSGFVRTVYPESSAQYTLIGTTGGMNPDSGDIYLGLDRFSRVIDANWANVAGTATLARVKYGYNRVSSRTWRDNLSPGMTGYDELYGYDQLQRLQNIGRGSLNGSQTAITSPTFGQDWTLDETGNWNGFKQDNTGSGTWNLDQTRTANTVNEITSLVNETSKAWTTPAYDKAGNMTRIPVPGTLPDGVAWNTMSLSDWDNLKLADWEEMTLDNVEGVYDAWNRLVRLHVGDTTLAEYTYDARGYRIRKDSYTDGALTEARHYYYTPGWQVVEERVGTSTSANRQFVWGLRYIDDLVLRDRDTDGNGTLDERRYGLQDGNWNTIALASTSGTVTERFSYDAYGVPTFLAIAGAVQATSLTGWETLYAGYRWDGDPSRMYYVRNRFLLPYVGTWNQRDPIGYGDVGDLLVYAGNHPIGAVDPLGLDWTDDLLQDHGISAYKVDEVIRNYANGIDPSPADWRESLIVDRYLRHAATLHDGPAVSAMTDSQHERHQRTICLQKIICNTQEGYPAVDWLIRRHNGESSASVWFGQGGPMREIAGNIVQGYGSTVRTTASVRGRQNMTTNALPKYRTPTDYLEHAVGRQFLQRAPSGGFKQSWMEGGFKFEVRIHPADQRYSMSGSIYRVSRQVVPSVIDPSKQGSGLEYIDATSKWHHQMTLKPGQLSNPNPLFNSAAAKSTHIDLPSE